MTAATPSLREIAVAVRGLKVLRGSFENMPLPEDPEDRPVREQVIDLLSTTETILQAYAEGQGLICKPPS